MAEIMSVLFFHTMRYKVSAPRDLSSDRFVLSKGHAAPILYAGKNFKYVLIEYSNIRNIKFLNYNILFI